MKGANTHTVLLVDDQAAVRKYVSRLLSNSGYTVLEASGGVEALRMCEKHDGPIDLLLADVIMPAMGGWELAERVKLIQPSVQVLFISGYADEVIASRGSFKRGTNFLQKPFAPAELIEKVREMLNSDGPGKASGSAA
jgi:two-component system, cell cycle sensor histidine kinase and response regulator CckA